jgi:methanol--5-hydroxybenzimidazolylcobamide Co-methyltransferase
VENVRLYGGWAPQVFTEILGYDVALLNSALRSGFQTQLRDLFVAANPLDPQVLVLSPEGAWKIGSAIVTYPDDYYLRAKEAAQQTLEVINKGYQKNRQELRPAEARLFHKIRDFLDKAPDNSETFIDRNTTNFAARVENFSPKNYGL